MARSKDFDEQEVLAKAMQVFWQKGYKGTSMQDLIDALGISRSSLYDTYTDKHTLYLKALEAYRSKGTQRIREIIVQGGSAKNVLRRLLELSSLEGQKDAAQKGCFLLNAGVEVAASDPAVGAMICDNDREMEAAFCEVIQRGQEAGEIRNLQSPAALARFLFNSVKGMRVSIKSGADPAGFADIIDLSLSIL